MGARDNTMPRHSFFSPSSFSNRCSTALPTSSSAPGGTLILLFTGEERHADHYIILKGLTDPWSTFLDFLFSYSGIQKNFGSLAYFRYYQILYKHTWNQQSHTQDMHGWEITAQHCLVVKSTSNEFHFSLLNLLMLNLDSFHFNMWYRYQGRYQNNFSCEQDLIWLKEHSIEIGVRIKSENHTKRPQNWLWLHDGQMNTGQNSVDLHQVWSFIIYSVIKKNARW